MRKPTLSPDDDVRIENLVTSHALLVAEVQRDKADRRQMFASLQRIERALAVPLYYSRKEACKRLGISISTAYKDPRQLPKLAAENPARYRVTDVEEMASEKQDRPAAHQERKKRPA